LNELLALGVMAKFYLDTCIWRDYYENRSDKFRPLGEWAAELINRAKKGADFIIYSDAVIKELSNYYSPGEIQKILSIAKDRGFLIKANVAPWQCLEARKVSTKRGVSFGDALHAIIARDNCAVLISRDKHFLELSDIAPVRKPEELI